VAPFNYYELCVAGIHKVLSSYETDGKHTNDLRVSVFLRIDKATEPI
jgi:hypothetical protein